jgi:hypothetical protein
LYANPAGESTVGFATAIEAASSANDDATGNAGRGTAGTCTGITGVVGDGTGVAETLTLGLGVGAVLDAGLAAGAAVGVGLGTTADAGDGVALTCGDAEVAGSGTPEMATPPWLEHVPRPSDLDHVPSRQIDPA